MLKAMVTGLVCVSLTAPAAAQANAVSDWNAITMTFVYGAPNPDPAQSIPAGRGGPPGLLDIALVHLAIHDAVQSIEGRFQPYAYSDTSQRGVGSPAAAVAAAAHRMLVLLYPTQQARLDARYADYLQQHGLVDDPALPAGEAAAAAIHQQHYRAAIARPPFHGTDAVGQWRSVAPMVAEYLAVTKPYALVSASQFRPQPPPPLASEVYHREYEEVRTRGWSQSHPTVDTDAANFWYTFNYFTGWNATVRQLASSQSLNVGDSARLFALTSLAAADAIIAVWDSKRFYTFWRPDMAIRAGDDDGNRFTTGDLVWTPHRANPAYPEYVSGANGLTAAFTGTLRLFFGTDEMAFSVTNPDGSLFTNERHFTRLSDIESEVVEARILTGIHFRAADEEARRLGLRVAHWVVMGSLQPVPGVSQD